MLDYDLENANKVIKELILLHRKTIPSEGPDLIIIFKVDCGYKFISKYKFFICSDELSSLKLKLLSSTSFHDGNSIASPFGSYNNRNNNANQSAILKVGYISSLSKEDIDNIPLDVTKKYEPIHGVCVIMKSLQDKFIPKNSTLPATIKESFVNDREQYRMDMMSKNENNHLSELKSNDAILKNMSSSSLSNDNLVRHIIPFANSYSSRTEINKDIRNPDMSSSKDDGKKLQHHPSNNRTIIGAKRKRISNNASVNNNNQNHYGTINYSPSLHNTPPPRKKRKISHNIGNVKNGRSNIRDSSRKGKKKRINSKENKKGFLSSLFSINI